MTAEHRRSERVADFLPLEVYVVRMGDGQSIAGPFSGRIIDISAHGACLLMTQIMQGGFHLFHSTREIGDAVLKLAIDQQPEIGPAVLTALPVWMDVFRQREIRAFKMGVAFSEDPGKEQMRELREALQKNQAQRGSWWRRHCLAAAGE